MRKKNYKGRCVKRDVNKCSDICRTYDPIQTAYADILANDDEISEFSCNVPMDKKSLAEIIYERFLFLFSGCLLMFKRVIQTNS